MSNRATCPQGHQWEMTPDGQEARCPVCGAVGLGATESGVQTSQPEKTEALDQTLQRPSPAPSTLLPEFTPGNTPGALDVTLVHPRARAADDRQVPPQLDQTMDPHTLPRQPQLVTAGVGSGARAPKPEPAVGGYEVIATLGRGGMGVVYKARQVGLNRLVALKMILAGSHASAEEQMRFRIEAEAIARVQHANIVQVYDVGERDGHPYLALEFIEGGTLQQKIANGPMRAREAAQLMEALARGVHCAHQQGVIHRDLKPANIMLTQDGVPKITDFGLAKRLDSNMGQTRTGEIMGTPSYMAPEQAAGRSHDIGPGTDIYALGAILYDMLTGRPPFQAASVVEALEQVRSQEPVPPSRLQLKLPRDLDTICLKCLQKEPAKRYTSAFELAEDLHRFLVGEPIMARPVGDFERAVRWCRRNPTVAGLMGALLLLFLSSIAFTALVWRESSRQYDAMAIQSGEMQARALVTLRELYSKEVVARAKAAGVEITHDYAKRLHAIPLPATLVIELGDEINKDRPGADVRLYSDYPFPWRKGGRRLDEFETEALRRLRLDPEQPFYRFEELDGRPSLRYAVADRMKASCLGCHNSHPDSPKKDWREGDVRGVLEVIRPLDEHVAEVRSRLQWAFVIPIATVALGVVTLLVFLVRRRRHRTG